MNQPERHHLIFCLGGNTDSTAENMRMALSRLLPLVENATASRSYPTDPEGSAALHGRPYLNMILICDSSRPLAETETFCKALEREAGRDDAARKAGIVPLDIDIVVADGKVLRKRDFDSTFFRKGLVEELGIQPESIIN